MVGYWYGIMMYHGWVPQCSNPKCRFRNSASSELVIPVFETKPLKLCSNGMMKSMMDLKNASHFSASICCIQCRIELLIRQTNIIDISLLYHGCTSYIISLKFCTMMIILGKRWETSSPVLPWFIQVIPYSNCISTLPPCLVARQPFWWSTA